MCVCVFERELVCVCVCVCIFDIPMPSPINTDITPTYDCRNISASKLYQTRPDHIVSGYKQDHPKALLGKVQSMIFTWRAFYVNMEPKPAKNKHKPEQI